MDAVAVGVVGGSDRASTRELVEKILEIRRHPEQGYRTCLGLLRLTKKYGDARVEGASTRALAARAYSYRHVKSILEHGLDRQAVLPSDADEPTLATPTEHENIRGAKYYH